MGEENKINTRFIFFIGLAFFTTELAWSLYNARVSKLLEGYLIFLSLVGIWMSLDNIIGVIIQPIMGSISDNTRTKLGRRMPYIIIGIPSGALFFALIPTQQNLIQLIIWMFFFSIAMGFYRSQAVALMPDFVKPINRSKGNAIINMMGGLGGVFGYGLSLIAGLITLQGSFIIASVLMVLSLIILVWKVKEKESYSYKSLLEREQIEGRKIKEEKQRPSIIDSFKDIFKEKDKSTLIMGLAIFSWFVAFQGLAALLTIYGTNVLLQTEDFSGFLAFFVALPIIIFAYPFAIIAGKIGRRNAIKIGLIIMITCLIIIFFIGFMRAAGLIPIIILLVITGIGWSFVNVNSIVIIWELAPTNEKIGTYTGIYYFFSFSAAITGPLILGSLTDLFNNPLISPPFTLILNGAIFLIIALVLMFFVKRGEPELTEEEKFAKQKAIQEL
ncbi:MAG: MFS transporter [Candidatus Thorarchaeota archaeon]